MENTNRQLKIGAMLSYVNLALGSIIPLLYTPIMLKMLGNAEYGLYSLSSSVIGYLSLLTFGFGGTIVRYITIYKASGEKKKEEEIFGFFLLLYSVIALIILLLGFILSKNVALIFGEGLTTTELHKMNILVLIMAFNSALSLPTSVYVSLTMAHEKYIFRRVLDIILTVATPVCNLIALYLGAASVGMALVGTLVQVIMFPLNVLYSSRKLDIHPKFAKIPKNLIKEMIQYSFFVFVASIVDMLFWSTDKIILGMLAGTTAIAIYNIGSTFNTMITGLSTSVSTLLTPRVTTMVFQGASREQLSDLFIRIGRIQYYVVALVISGFIVFGQSFISLWVGDSYMDAYWIAIVTLVPLTIPLIQNTGLSILMAQNKHSFRANCYLIIAILNVICTYMVVPYYGVLGAAVCSGISYLLGQGIIMNIYYYKNIGIDIPLFWKNILKNSVVPILLVIVSIKCLSYVAISNWVVFFGFVILYTMLYLILVFKFNLNNYEKKLFKSLIHKGV